MLWSDEKYKSSLRHFTADENFIRSARMIKQKKYFPDKMNLLR